MKISSPETELICDERDIYERLLTLQDADILELGCGKADKTMAIAKGSKVASIVALEVDEIQHAENLRREAPDNVKFGQGGAEAIPAGDLSFGIVMMFKSLHHVPVELMDEAMGEIHRVLKEGGVAYISEPVFAGDFNEILRLFHDEQKVREAAFASVKRAVESGRFTLASQTFFSTPMHFSDFSEFETKILKVTHTQHRLSEALYQEVRQKFMRHMTPEGAMFQMPIRVDLLRKAG